ncbi:signal peptidase I [Paenibacillus sp. PK3_47]|uniref:signal peptidase I n=1 Tax=Paenibacillus sp. PK3_47 TaxID=2072642 RepID=UPI00201DA7C8|nr:signal peptidase I [Paenibacillus sp. PK3_47]
MAIPHLQDSEKKDEAPVLPGSGNAVSPSAAGGKSGFWGWVRFLAVLGISCFLIFHSIGLTRISGNSMNPSLNNGNVLLVNKWPLYTGSPGFGDVVVIRTPQLPYDIIKRVIGTEGDTVAIKDGTVLVNGHDFPELYAYGIPEDMDEVYVGAGEVFVLGDNRTPGESLDSRSPELGLVPEEYITGYGFIKLIPWGAIARPLEF